MKTEIDISKKIKKENKAHKMNEIWRKKKDRKKREIKKLAKKANTDINGLETVRRQIKMNKI